MLELKNIVKDYPAGDGTVHALKGVSLQFRPNEFVAILGQSGCGKTTMLNIIGGLDQYTCGDLIINGRSTKEYKDRDWDAYRNHSIGFVFQSYNLIPHQTVLQNVELALTLSGVGKAERRKRAIAALESVGLGNQLLKKPSQMSGGQMQRVAIARALVNNPDIILADEPTGALDSETSVQVMDILKEVARDRLVIMVTHNPDLADAYATRTIRMLDGELLSDSDPVTEAEAAAYHAADKERTQTAKKEKKPAMKLTTAYGLSLKNLIAKRSRTLLTSFAGSIGIIGIALIYAVSQGMSTYITTVQEDTLSSYPLTIQATTVDLGSMMTAFMDSAMSKEEHENDAVYSKGMLYDLVNAMSAMETTENDLEAFKVFLENAKADPNDPLHEAISGLQYSYNLQLPIYTKNVDGEIIESDAQKLMEQMMGKVMGTDLSSMFAMRDNAMSSFMGSSSTGFQIWQEMLPGDNGAPISDLLDKQYDLIYGSWPNSYNEIVLVVDSHNELADMTLYALGLKSLDDMEALMNAAMNGETLEGSTEKWSYEDICAMEFRVVLPGDCYTLDETTGLYTDMRQTDAGVRYLYDNATVLRVTGIIRPNEEAASAMLTGTIGYTSVLTEHIIENAKDSAAVKAQLKNPTVDIFTGLPFQENTGSLTAAQKEAKFREHLASLDETALADAYIAIMSIPPQSVLDAMVQETVEKLTVEDMKATLIQTFVAQMGMNEETIADYVDNMSDEDVVEIYTEMVIQQKQMEYAMGVAMELAMVPDAELVSRLNAALGSYTQEDCAKYYDEILVFSDASYEDNLVTLGSLELSDPAAISIFASTFESKDVIEAAIEKYNSGVEEAQKISYTDYVGLMMSSITTIIDAITYVLIAFVAISLVVSSIMIGVITLISVQERVKEIGILRAIGASKRNVSSMFNAETVMIGLASGLIGVGLTVLLCLPINAIIFALTDIAGLKAYLPWQVGLVLIGISILLSVFAGLIPARSAAKKDPVVALRTE